MTKEPVAGVDPGGAVRDVGVSVDLLTAAGAVLVEVPSEGTPTPGSMTGP